MHHALFLQETASARVTGVGPFLREFWPLLLPPLLGLVAVYLLLPRARRLAPAVAGAVAGAFALVLAAAVLVHLETVWPEALLFYCFAGIAVLAGASMVVQANPVYSALSFALVVLSTCGLFLLQGAPFLMAATIIIYAGAIVVTFLFVIMLSQQEGTSSADRRSREPFLATLAGFVLMAATLCVLYRAYDTREIDALIGQLRAVQEAKTDDEVKRAVGPVEPVSDAEVRRDRPVLTQRLRHYLPDDHAAINNLEDAWSRPLYSMVKVHAGKIVPDLEAARATRGLLTVADPRRAPGAVHTVAADPAEKAGTDRRPPPLPHRNVAAIGGTLFTDYLIPVEVAALLLLVATIGAIAVASRRTEELR